MVLDKRASQALTEAEESGLVEVMRGGDTYSEWEILDLPRSSASSPLGLCQPHWTPRPQGRTQMFHPPGNIPCCSCKT